MPKKAEILEIPATITERGQTTVPAAIRKVLSLGKRDRVIFRALADGTVVIAKIAEKNDERAEDRDPVIGKFLDFLARDMVADPGRIRPVSADLVARAIALVEDVEVDLEAALSDDDA
jgi:antitoxin PrlF